MRRPQSVKKGVWYLGGRKKKRVVWKKQKKFKGSPLGPLASVRVPFVGEIAKPIIKKILVEEKEDIDDDRKNTVTMTCRT